MSLTRSSARILLAGVALLVFLSGLLADDKKEGTLSGKVQAGVHSIKMEADRVYRFRIEAKGFVPVLYPVGFLRKAKDGSYEGQYYPSETKTYRVVVAPSAYAKLEEGPLEYKLSFTSAALAKPLLQEKGELKPDDPPYKGPGNLTRGPHKAYKVTLKAGQSYMISMTSTQFDSYLILEGPDGKVVAQDDDSGNNLNARIIYRPGKDGEYRVIATALAVKLNKAGAFNLTVRPTGE